MIPELQFAVYSLVLAALGAVAAIILKRHPEQRKDMSSPKMSNPNETLMPVSYTHLTLPTKRIV